MFFKSLKSEILTLTLGLTILTIVITAVLGVSSTRTAGSDAESATSDTLRKQAKESLVQIAKSTAQQQDLLFARISDDTRNLATFTKNIYENPSTFYNTTYWDFDTRMFKKDGRFLNAASDTSTLFIPNFVTVDANVKTRAELTSYLDFVAPSILTSNPNVVALYTTDTKGVARYYPNIILGNVVPPDYNTLEDIVYTQATPSADPEKKVVWSLPYDDPAQRGLMITNTAPIYGKSGFLGVFASDVLLNSIIKTITSYSPIEGSYAFLIDKDGETIAFPDKAYPDILGRPRKEGEVRTNLASSSPEFLPLLKEMRNGMEGFGSIHSGNQELFVAYAPLKETGFSLGIVAKESVMLKASTDLQNEISGSVQDNILMRVLPVSLLIILIASFISVLLVARIIKPIRQLTRGAEEIGHGNLDYNITIESKNEIGTLAISFNQMSQALKKSRQELYEYSRGLEEKVKERTQELSDANTRQESLLHFVSHEVKVYLTKAMYAFASIADGDFGSVSAQLDSISREALSDMREGLTTVLDILGAASLKNGTIKYNKNPFDLKDAVASVVRQQKSMADNKHIGLDITTTGEGSFILDGDEEKIAQHVVRNIIDNAIKYTPSGDIHIELSRTEHAIRFSVSDNGIGITPEDMLKLFTEGGKGKDSLKTNVHSTGYGLFVAKMVTDAHGAKIWAESKGAGSGARFVVEFPLV